MDRIVQEFSPPQDPCRAIQVAENLEDYLLIRPQGPWMIPETIAYPPSGQETGVYWVVDVGGSTVRIAEVDLEFQSTSVVVAIALSPAAKQDIVEFVVLKLREYGVQGNVALTWSFPLIDGIIQPMGKGFSSLYVGMDLASVFNHHLEKAYAACKVVSVCTDGASALIAQRFLESDCNISLTWGTGININLFMEGVVVNSEISMLGREYDRDTFYHLRSANQYDEVSTFQPLESLVGGLYLERIAERALGKPIDFWAVLHDLNHAHFKVVQAIADRAARIVAGVLTAFLRHTDYYVVAYTGGVINEPFIRQTVEYYVQSLGQRIEFVPQVHGSMFGAAVLAAMNEDAARKRSG